MIDEENQTISEAKGQSISNIIKVEMKSYELFITNQQMSKKVRERKISA